MSRLREKSSINENRKINIFSVCASEECKIFTSWCWSRGFKRWRKKWGKFPDEPLSWLYIKKKPSQDVGQRFSPKGRNKDSMQRTRTRYSPGTLVLCPTQLVLCWFFLYHFHFLKLVPSYLLEVLYDSSSMPRVIPVLDFSSSHQELNVTDVYPTLQSYHLLILSFHLNCITL